MKPAIQVEGISKQFRIGARPGDNYRTFREAIMAGVRAPWNRLRRRSGRPAADRGGRNPLFWALRDVSFDVRPGEAVAIIGRNGSGKSTLLKILSQIYEPTAGRAVVRGRLASLLEVGTGFHHELTGRENIYLNGSILGMSRKEIDRQFDAIVAFSEIESFLDTPVKRYSSGMYVRLAFAVAAHLQPELLIVDEVLAVGDAQFQKKCLGKMQDVADAGRTVLFVSHNMTAVQGLCTRAVWLDQGRLAGDGPVKEVISEYLRKGSTYQTEQVWDDRATAPGGETFRLRRACVRPADGSDGAVTVRTPLVLEFEYWNFEAGAHLNLSLHIYNEEGVRVFNTFPVCEPNWQGRPFPVGLFRSTCYLPGDFLNDGTHRVQLLAVKDAAHVIHNHHDVLTFEVADERDPGLKWHGRWMGAVRPNLDWTTELLRPGSAPTGCRPES